MVDPPASPTGIFTYPGDTQIQDVLLLPDGLHALALLRIGSVNLWSVLVYYWVEIVAVAGVSILVVLLWRLLGRPLVMGGPHCRRCKYPLVGLDGEVCPECGAALTSRNRIIGRPRRLRVVIALALLVGIVAGYVTGRPRLTRVGSVNTWCQWLSPGLYDWAWHADHDWLHRHKSWRARVVEIDLDTGRVTRTLFSRDGIVPGPVVLHPDGQSFFLSQGDIVSRHDLARGRRLAAFRAAGVKRFQQVSLNEHGDTVYAVTLQRDVWAWRPADGTHERILESDLLGNGYNLLLPYQDRLISYRRMTNTPDSTIWDLTTRQRLGSLNLGNPTFRPSQDGRWLVCPAGPDFDLWDLRAGALRETIRPWWAPAGFPVVVPGADRRYVVLPRYGPTELHLWDIERSTWARACAAGVTMWTWARLSADDSRLVAIAVAAIGGGTQYKIITWDLP